MAVHEDTLTKFLLDLSTDPDRAAQFAANPDIEARRARLSNEERVAVFSGDPSKIRERIAANDNGTGIMTRQPLKRKKRNGTGIMKKKKKRPAPKKKRKGSRKRAAKK